MPMDGLTLRKMRRELSGLLTGGRVDRVTQPEKDALILTIRSQGGNHRLMLCANADQARAQITAAQHENPASPPMFCMLMRKHLLGARVIAINQLGTDRVITITFENMGEMGDISQKTLYVELMGRHSNITLVDDSGVIVDAIRHVNSDMSRVRTVLPGQSYRLPPQKDKLNIDDMTPEALSARLTVYAGPLDRALMDNIAGIASVSSQELCARVGAEPGIPVRELGADAVARRVVDTLSEMAGAKPALLTDAEGVAQDYFPFTYVSRDISRQKEFDTLSAAMDAFYLGRETRLRMRQRGASLAGTIRNNIDRLEKKKAILLDAVDKSEKADAERVCGELLTAGMHALKKGDSSVTLTNYYDENQSEIAIQLDPLLTPPQNAQRYFRRYRKLKTAGEYARAQLGGIDGELSLLENALCDLEKCQTHADLSEIRQLLISSGYIKPDAALKRQKKPPEGKPYTFRSESGTEILVGKNALQNDRLTLRARGNETWLHAQGIPGSHVLIRAEESPDDGTLLKAAKLAAYFSKGRRRPAQPVDYTLRKYVKKGGGAPAGLVTYTNFKTILITLDASDMALMEKETE